MKTFQEVVGHDSIIAHMQRAIEKGKVSHAYIISGEAGSGKKLLSGIFAKTLQCKEQGKSSCDMCQSCVQADSGNHPDIIRVTHEKVGISVEDIRNQVNDSIDIKPYSSKYKIYIIDEADKMTEQAQNALLKNIEEPPTYVVFILLVTSVGKLLPTIVSRCVLLNLKPVSIDETKKYLMNEYQIPEYEAEISAKFSRGNIGKAIRYATSEDFTECKDNILYLLKYMDGMKVHEITEGIKLFVKDKIQIYDYIDLMVLWYRDILLFKVTGNLNLLLFRDEFSAIKKQAQECSYEGIENILKAMDKAKMRLRANVNFDIAIELMLLVIKENGNG